MSTRGLWGFVVDGRELLTYNHHDSYPEGLGSDLLAWLRETPLESVRERARALVLVDGLDEPTAEQIDRLRRFHDPSVSTGEPTEWYSLLRRTQGDPEATLDAGVMIDGSDFALDSLFCEYGYVIDLDRGIFEIYRGLQEEPHARGRFADRAGEESRRGHWPIALAAEMPLDDLPPESPDLRTDEERAEQEEEESA